MCTYLEDNNCFYMVKSEYVPLFISLILLFVSQYPSLNLEALEKGAQIFVGTHNFAGFAVQVMIDSLLCLFTTVLLFYELKLNQALPRKTNTMWA